MEMVGSMFDFLNSPSGGTSAWKWVKCHHPELVVMGLPEEVPWPGEIVEPPASEPLPIHELLRGLARAQADPSVTLAPIWGNVMAHTEASALCRLALNQENLKEAGRLLDMMDSLIDCAANWHMRGEWHLRRGNTNSALRMFEKCTAAFPQIEMPWIHYAKGYSAGGHPERAIKILLRGMAACPGSQVIAEGLVDLRHFYRFGTRPPRFERTLRESRSPDTETCRYVDAKGYKQAVEAQIQRAGNSVAKLVDISIDVADHRFDSASEEQVYQQILQLDPSHRATQVRLAGLHIRNGNLEKGESLLAQAGAQGEVEISEDAEVLFQLHELALKRGDPQASARWVQAALDADPDHAAALGILYFNNPALSDSEREKRLRKHARQNDSSVAANLAGQFAMKRMDQHQAVADMELALEIDPDDKTNLINYTQGLYSIGEHEKLAAFLQPNYKARKLDWTLKWPYSVALYELGHRADALKVIDEILRDKRLPKSEYPRLMEQRDNWTGYAGFPPEEYRLRFEFNPDRLSQAVVMTRFNGEETGSMAVIPAGSRENTSNEMPFDGLPSGTNEVRIELAQEAAGLFTRKTQLGAFILKGIEPAKLRNERLFVTFQYAQHGCIYVRARQGKRKLKVEWNEPQT